VARPVENNDDQILDVAIEPLGDRLEIVGDRSIEFDRTFTRRAHNDFFHVQVRGVQQAAFFAGGKYSNRASRAGGAEIGALQWVDGYVYFGKQCLRRVRRE